LLAHRLRRIDGGRESVYSPVAMRAGAMGGLAAALAGALVLAASLTSTSHADDGACAVPVAYPGDDAARDVLARWMAHGARARGVPAELPVMAALESSGLRNLPSGDRDSVGFFQMRTGIWDRGPYAGFPDHPDLQLTWFLDQALAVRQRAVAAGDASFGKDPSRWGAWIADVERPAEQFRGRYQLRLDEATALAACTDTPAPPTTAPETPTPPPTTTEPGNVTPQPTLSARLVRVGVVTTAGVRTMRVVLRMSTQARAQLQLLRKGSPRLRRVVALKPGRTTIELPLPATLAGGWYRLAISFPGSTGAKAPPPRPLLLPAGRTAAA
jgi:hypothetical protein